MNFSKNSTNKKLRTLRSPYRKYLRLVETTFFRLIVFGILLSIVIGGTSAYGVFTAVIDSSPTIDYDALLPKGYTSFITDSNGRVIQELSTSESNRIYTELDLIPKYVADAFIAIEDERYYEHNGIDMKGIFRAIFVNLKDGKFSEGASTITQQLIKNSLLTTEKSFERKIQEQYLAMEVEKILDKDEILELYLNTVALGRGTNGVQSAAKRYYNKDISQVTIAEAASIAAITQRPTYYDPVVHPDNNKQRQLIILDYMFRQGKISQSDKDTAVSEDIYSNISVVNDAFEGKGDYSYFVDEVILQVAKDLELQKGYTTGQALNLIYSGGLQIFSTQDITMQSTMEDAFLSPDNFPSKEDDYQVKLLYNAQLITEGMNDFKSIDKLFETNEEATSYLEALKEIWLSAGSVIKSESINLIPQPQAAMIIIDYYTGQVKAMSGGRGEKVGNQTLNRATMSLRQPGSTFKVLAAYLPAIDSMGYTLATVQDDVPYTVTLSDGSTYSPKNWYDQTKNEFNYWGLSSIRKGIEWSMNIVAVKTMFDIGIPTGFNYLKKLGFTSLVDREEINGQIFTDKNIVLPLGGLTKGVSLLELTGAYAAIANNGVYNEPIFYSKVLDRNGSILLLNEPESNVVMKPTTSFLLTNAMEDVVTSGTAKVAKFDGMPIAGKTGTTSDSKDLTFIGYTPYYIGGIWLGHDDPQKMTHNQSYQKLLWKIIMEDVHEGLPYKNFPRPNGIVEADICIDSGKLAVEGLCDEDQRGSRVKREYFAKGTEPTEYCDMHVKMLVCEDTGLIPTEYCPENTILEKVFIVRDEPLDPSTWDPTNPPRIRDRQYELPVTLDGEYCNVHVADEEINNSLEENIFIANLDELIN